MSVKKIANIAGGVVALAVLLIFGGSFFESVEGGEIHVKQAAVSGDLSVYTEEGLYTQMFGRITKYYRTYETYLSSDELDGGSGQETSAILVRFGDGGTADVSSVTQWRLPLDDDSLIKIHRNFRTSSNLAAQARQWIIEVEKQTASIFKADETYSTRRGEFQQLISEQVSNGLYATETVEVEVETNEIDDEGNPVMATSTRVIIKRDADGIPIIVKPGIFQEYNLELVNHSLKDIVYDESIEALIAQKKEAEQARAVAITNAERALQDAITAEAEGQARVAQARANEEVTKITAVTQAEKEKEVAELNAQRELEVARLGRQAAEEEAEANLVRQRAEAEANRLKVAAGLTPQERAEFERETAIGVARELAKTQFPQIMNFGTETGVSNPLDAIGYNQMFDLVQNMSNSQN